MNCRYRMRIKALWKCRKIKVKKNTLVFVNIWKNPPIGMIKNGLDKNCFAGLG